MEGEMRPERVGATPSRCGEMRPWSELRALGAFGDAVTEAPRLVSMDADAERRKSWSSGVSGRLSGVSAPHGSGVYGAFAIVVRWPCRWLSGFTRLCAERPWPEAWLGSAGCLAWSVAAPT